jgi:hypothetical protein
MNALYDLYLLVLAFATLMGILQFRYFNKPDRYVFFLIAITLITEFFANSLANRKQSNLFLYQIFTPFQLMLYCLYFNETVRFFKRSKIPIIFGGMGIIVAIINYITQPGEEYNPKFLAFESLVIILLCLSSYFPLLIKEEINIMKYFQFWVTTIFLLFWGFSFYRLTMFTRIADREMVTKSFQYLFVAINLITYSSLGILFFKYKKLIRTGE